MIEFLFSICGINSDLDPYHFFATDSESDTEVPYADIMITVRGISTPELTQVGYLAPGDQNEVRGKFQS